MEHLLPNLAVGLMAAFYMASVFCYDRLLRIESSTYHEQWLKDGRPVGPFTLARQGEVAFRLRSADALGAFVRCYVLWTFSAPAWVRGDLSAHRFLSAARILFVIGIYVQYLMMTLM